MKLFLWLKPGLKIKRWIIMCIVGFILISIGINIFLEKTNYIGNKKIYIISLVVAGSLIVVFSVIGLFDGLVNLLVYSGYSKYLGNIGRKNKIYDRGILSKGIKVVVIGGGTGLSVLLRGMKKFTSNITAIVTVADDGGGSGKLREDLGMLPPGDIRNCILALSNTEPIMEKLLQYRFKEGDLKGQSFGNLLIAAMVGISENFEEAIKRINDIFAVMGKVLPVTTEDVTLYAKLENDQIIKGESQIPKKSLEAKSGIKKVFIKPRRVNALEESIEAIKAADVIVLGPGSLYTSIMPNLLVEDIPNAIDKSKAIKVYVSNLMTQPGETDSYSISEHVKAIENHINKNIVEYVYANNEIIPEEVFNKYKDEGASPVLIVDKDKEYFKEAGIKVVEDNFIEIKKGYIRHDATRLSEEIIKTTIREKYDNDRLKLMELSLLSKKIRNN